MFIQGHFIKLPLLLLMFFTMVWTPGVNSEEMYWVEEMKKVHARFNGQKGTFAHFGDSITVTMAFWAPLPYARKNASPQIEQAFQSVNHYMRPECWRDWKGPEYGNEGGQTVRWAYEHIDEWLARLNPEVALIMFGTNDLQALELEEYETKMRAVAQKCLDNGTIVILSTIPPRTGFVEKASTFAEAVREIARDLKIPLVDFQAEILQRRPEDWDGSLDKFRDWEGYDVPTLIARDGVHPSHPQKYQNDYSEEALTNCGYSLRNYLVLMKYAEVIEKVLKASGPGAPGEERQEAAGRSLRQIVTVHNAAELRDALAQVRAGMWILLEAGEYPGGFYFSSLQGEPGKPIVIAASDPSNPPIIKGGGEGMHLTDSAYIELHHLIFTGATGNGLNIDDGGSYDTPAHHIVLRGLKVTEVGPKGNCDGIKLSGVDDFRIEDCTVERWGNEGQGIDMVGCHRGIIEGCTIRFEDERGFGIQAKGGSSQITIRRCRFEHAGHRAINIGGSTGLQFFRPPLKKGERHYEAKEIVVEGCTFIGAIAPVAFVGIDKAIVRFNTIYRPKRWALRILQETTADGFVPCCNGEFHDNIVVFRSDEWFEGGVNIGPNTAPETFKFARNFWYCLDKPEKSRPALPTEEVSGVYGKDPLFWDAEGGDLHLRPASPARHFGPAALRDTLINPPHQPWFPKAPPLPPPKGEIIRVASVEELFQAVERVKPGGTILLSDGHYMMPRYLEIHTDNVTLRGESGHRERVILDGSQSRHGELVGITRCSGVTIADLTIQNIKWNGFKINSDSNVQKVTIYNCIIHNIWQRGVKGVRVPKENLEEMRPKNCRIQYCLFYNDRPKRFSDDPADTPENFNGDYIGGIDVMFAKNWIISDNVFIGIQGRTRQGRGAIFLWHDTQDCVVERNIIIDCDTGIALGNSYLPPDISVHCTRVIARNNFITRCPESDIVADYTRDCHIVHNTIYDPKNRLGRLIRLVHDNDGLLVANNLLSGPPIRNESTSRIEFKGNLEKDLTFALLDPEQGNLRLTARAVEAMDKAFPLPEVKEDIDRRPRGSKPDIGAHEFINLKK